LKRVKIGFCVPVYAGASAYSDAINFDAVKAAVLECERLGYDSIWTPDHLIMGQGSTILEGWTILSALAPLTKKIKIGTLVLCNPHRHPSLVAKMAATLDVISKGRLEFFFDAGWNGAECLAYGIPWYEKAQVRIERMGEALEVIRRMWTEDEASFQGRHYQIRNALCEPKPLQKPYPPIWIGAIGATPRGEEEPFLAGRDREGELKPLMTTVAKYADVWNNTPIPPKGYKQQLEILEEYCHKVGRGFDEIEKSLETQVLVAKDEKGVDAALKRIEALNPKQTFYGSMDVYKKFAIIGTPDECIEKVEAYVNLGVTYFIIWFLDFPSLKSIRLLAEEVIPQFK